MNFWDRLGTDEGGMPQHLPMPVNAEGQGPELESLARGYTCWCSDPKCPLALALEDASKVYRPPGEQSALAAAEDLNQGHTFTFTAEVRGVYRVVGEEGYKEEPDDDRLSFTFAVREWSLSAALEKASRLSFSDLMLDLEREDENE